MPEMLINGNTLHSLRLRAGMTVPALSERATYIGRGGEEKHVSVSSILNYETGRQVKISETNLMGLAHAFGVDVFELEKLLAPADSNPEERRSATHPIKDVSPGDHRAEDGV